MNWRHAIQRLRSWLFPGRAHPSATTALAHRSVEPTHRPYLTQNRIRTWRRRVLLNKGERMRIRMLETADAGWLAMLDAEGMVLACFDTSAAAVHAHVVDRHVAQFYAPVSIADPLARDHLRAAARASSSQHLGWRRCPNGMLFWAVTTIEPVVLRDGRLQGFSHVMRNADGPAANAHALAPASAIPSWEAPAASGRA